MGVGIPDGNAKKIKVVDVVIDHASCAANTSIETTVTVEGLKTTDIVFVNKPTLEAGLAVANARVSAVNTLAVQVINTTAGAIDEASETYKLLIVSPEGV